jgi:pyruvate-formate lyase-activating enzyme
MSDFSTLEPAIDPNNRISFLLDWELTMKCNLDCSYCPSHLYGGHDNSTPHPPVDECLTSIDFMFEYADLYMSTKPKGIRYVILNVYGGESLHHPDIVEILKAVKEKYKNYQDRWHLTVTTTTNAIINDRIMQEIIPLIDEFTASYHTENTPKQKQQFQDNLLKIKASGRRLKCVVLMHAEQDLFDDAKLMIAWLNQNQIRHLPRQLDHNTNATEFNYSEKQVTWFENLYQSRIQIKEKFNMPEKKVVDNHVDLADTGRACCGGRQVCQDQNYKSRVFYINNKFPDWYCSVNHFFVYIKQVTKEIFVNKDCKMNYDGTVGPIGHLTDYQQLLDDTKKQLLTNTIPVIQCKKQRCYCGLCAPKAESKIDYDKIIKKYQQKVTT